MQLWGIKEENGQGLDQVRPLRLVAVYRLVIGGASPTLTVEVDITRIRYKVHLSVPQSSTMHKQRLTEETHQAT